MIEQPIVSIYTQVYNTEAYLKRCIDSVLNQTFSNFEYILVDNGSTDGSSEILKQYAAKDKRIKLIRYEQNRLGPIWLAIGRDHFTGTYIANLDSDDWWDPNYIESLIKFLESNDLDLAITGTVNYFEEHKTSQVMRKLDTPIVLTRRQFAESYPQLWSFSSTNWANILRAELFQKAILPEKISEKLSNGGDTVYMLEYMKNCQRIGIDNTALYHYRIRPKQISRQYNQQRFFSNTYVYNEIKSFLEQNYAFTAPKQEWLKRVHLNSMNTTLTLLDQSDLPVDGKIAECARIIAHPLTSAALSCECQERDQWFHLAWRITLNAVGDNSFTDSASLQSIIAVLAPRCGPAVTKDTALLFMRDPDLISTLYQDAPDRLAEALLEFIEARQYVKQFDLVEMLQKLAADKPLLSGIDDIRFLRKYRDLYWLVWQGKLLEALDRMTGMLLEKKCRGAEEMFLQLYLSLAAQLEEIPAFLFGKTQLAAFFLRQGQAEACRIVLEELREMGAADNEEITGLRARLDQLSK